MDERGDAFGVLERGGEDGHHLGEVVPASTTKRLVVPLEVVLGSLASTPVEHAEDALVGGGVAAAGVGGEFQEVGDGLDGVELGGEVLRDDLALSLSRPAGDDAAKDQALVGQVEGCGDRGGSEAA